MVAEGDPDLQAGGHGHAVLPVQQGGHEPVEVEPGHLPSPGVLRVLPLQPGRLGHGRPVAVVYIIRDAQTLPQSGIKDLPPGVQIPAPGEGVGVEHFGPLEPGIAAEHLVGALT